LWGESLGCAVAARSLVGRTDVSGAVLWSLSADLYDRYSERYGGEVESRGFAYSPSGFKVTRAFLDSLHGEDTFDAIRDMGIPALLVHGTADDVASVELSRCAHAKAAANTELFEVPDGNHGFEAQAEQFGRAMTASLDWIHTRLQAESR